MTLKLDQPGFGQCVIHFQNSCCVETYLPNYILVGVRNKTVR